MAKLIDESNFEELVLNNSKPVMVDFFATWCGPCKMIAPFVDTLDSEIGEEAEVFKVNIDQNEGLCEKYHVSAVPTLLFFKDGKCVDRVEGAVSKDVMAQKLRALI